MRIDRDYVLAYLRKKKIIKGHAYWYAVKMGRVDGKPKPVEQIYLGTAEKIVEIMKGSLKFVEIVNKHTDKWRIIK